jgi:elongation factor P
VPSRGCHGEATTVEERLRLALSALADKSVCHRFCQHHYKCWNDGRLNHQRTSKDLYGGSTRRCAKGILTKKNHLWRVLEYQHIKVARGGGDDPSEGAQRAHGVATVEKTYNNGTRSQRCLPKPDKANVQCLYRDGEGVPLHEHGDLRTAGAGPWSRWTTSKAICSRTPWSASKATAGKAAVESELPTAVDVRVVWAEAAVQGDTANAPTNSRVGAGLRTQVPMFVQEGDVVRVDTTREART